MTYGAQFVSHDWKRMGLIRYRVAVGWHLPFAVHRLDGETVKQAVERSILRHFRSPSHGYNTRSRVDAPREIDYEFDTESVPECVVRRYQWTETFLNTHIQKCEQYDERPEWNEPGEVTRVSEYYIVRVDPDAVSGHALADSFAELRFFTPAEMKKIAHVIPESDRAALAWFMEYSPGVPSTPNDVDAPYNYEVDTPAIMIVVVTIAVIMVALVTASATTA
jgi:hypothetical protein